MTTRSIIEAHLNHPQSQRALRSVRVLVSGYLGISALTLVAIILLRDNSAVVTPAVWIRGTIVVGSALLTTLFVAQMARSSRSGYLRLRIVSAVMLVAIVTIIALPDPFPLWLKIEQGVCGLLLLGVVVIVNGKRLRSAFAAK